MEILKGFFSDLQGIPLYLNCTRIKSIQACLDSEKLPNLVPVLKLNDLDHHCSMTFSKETMKAIKEKSAEIKRSLRVEEEKFFFLNDELKVFSEKMHNKCAVSFLNFQGVRINMMLDTFIGMMNSSDDVLSSHKQIEQKLQKSAKNLKLLFDAIIAKFTECNINNPEYQSFLQQLQQCVTTLSQGAPASNNENNVVDITNDDDEDDDHNEDEDEDEEEDDEYDEDDYLFGRRRRRDWYDDDDDDEYRYRRRRRFW